jgi:putative ABC transport system permease protein
VLADLWAAKGRTLLVVASIAAGVFAVGAIASGSVIIGEDIDASYASVNPANVEVWTTFFDDALLRAVERLPGLTRAEGRRLLNARASKNGADWLNCDVYTTKDWSAVQVGQLELLDGVLVPGDRQLVVAYDPAKDPGFRVGDQVQIEGLDGTVRTLPVVGLVRDQASGGTPPPLRGYSSYVTPGTLEWLGANQPELYNRLYVTVDGGAADDQQLLDEMAAAIEDKIERSGRPIYRSQVSKTHEHPLVDIVLAVAGVLYALGALVLLLSGSLIYNTLNAILAQHLRQIGVMKLIGAYRLQVLAMYLAMIAAYGALALAIAIPLGGLAGYGLATMIANLMNAKLAGFRFVPSAIVLQMVVALVMPILAGFVPVNRGAKTTVRRAITGDRPDGGSPRLTWTDRLGTRFSWVSRPILLSIRNTFRRKGRLILTLFTLTMGGALFIGVFNVRLSMENFMAQLRQHFMADVTIYLDQPYRVSEVERDVLQVPGVRAVEAWSTASAEIQDAQGATIESLRLFGPPVDSNLLEPDLVTGRWLVPGDERALVVADAIWETLPNLVPGDELLVSLDGRRAEDWQVVGIFRFTSLLGDPLAYTDYDDLTAHLNQLDQSASYRVVTDAHGLQDQVRASRALDERLNALGYRVAFAQAGRVTQEENERTIDILVIFLMVMALLTAFVGSIGLAGTMSMSVQERTREIGVMRAIGAVDAKVMQSVLVEGTLIGGISWALAWGLSFPISHLLLTIITEAMLGSAIPLALTLEGVVIWLVAVLGLSALASVLPARNAARLTIREVLAYE